MEEANQKILSIVIMAHPDRRQMAEELALSLGGVPIVFDEVNNVWDTCRRAWQKIDKSAKYGLVLQDDVIVCRDFIRRAEALLTGNFVYNFFVHYVFANRVNIALADGKREFIRSTIASEVAICMPTKFIVSMINYCQKHKAKDDTLISSWALSKRIWVCYPIPSLCDHRAGESVFLKHTGRPQRGGSHCSCCFADNF